MVLVGLPRLLKGLELIGILLNFIASHLFHNPIRLALRRLRPAWLLVVGVSWTTGADHETIELGSCALGSAISRLQATDLLCTGALESWGKVVTSLCPISSCLTSGLLFRGWKILLLLQSLEAGADRLDSILGPVAIAQGVLGRDHGLGLSHFAFLML